MDSVPAYPIDDKEKYWLKNSVIDYVKLFIKDPILLPFKSEKDLLDDIYGFIKTSKHISNTDNEK